MEPGAIIINVGGQFVWLYWSWPAGNTLQNHGIEGLSHLSCLFGLFVHAFNFVTT